MDARLQRRVQRYGWDAAAETYEASWHRHLAPAHAALFEMADLRQGDTVIDIACGSGLVTIPAAGLVGASGRVVATDISEEMVRRTRNAANTAGLANITAARMDAEQLDLADVSFTTALCALGLMYVPDTLGALKEMHRVLAQDGRAIAAVWGDRRACGWAELFPVVDSVVQSDVCPMFFRTGTAHILADEFRQAGFTEMEERRIETVTRISSVEELHLAFLDSGPVALAAKRFTPDIRLKVEALFLNSVQQFRTSDGGFEIPGAFVVVMGVKQ
jgi:ubiquinone/menaquinone biosynthesis C-methylase UbiE